MSAFVARPITNLPQNVILSAVDVEAKYEREEDLARLS